MLDRISIELTDRCAKACWFCYNHSRPDGAHAWDPDTLTAFVLDCAANGVRAVSFGGGEPLQYPSLFDVLSKTRSHLFRSMTSNGLLLTPDAIARLADVGIDKVHLSIHFPDRDPEASRVIHQVHQLAAANIRSGINLLVARSNLPAATRAAERIRSAGIPNDRIVYLPMRGQDTPTPQELSAVAGNAPFQSMTCLGHCAKSPRFCSIAANHTVAWCSYTTTRRALPEPTYVGLVSALEGLGLTFCGGTHVPAA